MVPQVELEELKIPKRHFEMNGPIVNLYATLHTSPKLTFLCKHLTNLICPVKRYGNKKLKKERKRKKKDRQTLRCGWDRRQITYTFPRPFLFGVSREVNGGGALGDSGAAAAET